MRIKDYRVALVILFLCILAEVGMGVEVPSNGPLIPVVDPVQATVVQRDFQDIYHELWTFSKNSSTTTISSATITNATIGTLIFSADGSIQTSAADHFQTVQGTKTSVFSTTSSAFQATGLSVTITPKAANHHIKITVGGSVENLNGNLTACYVTVKRGNTDINLGTNGLSVSEISGGAAHSLSPMAFSLIDATLTSGTTTYQVYLNSSDNTTACKIVTQSGEETIIAEEIL